MGVGGKGGGKVSKGNGALALCMMGNRGWRVQTVESNDGIE
jgi:hypothetical protein